MCYSVIKGCRSCGSNNLINIFSYGDTPIADGLLTSETLNQEELLIPLSLVFCPCCTLLQIAQTVEPKVLFSASYPYFSSVSDELLAHSRKNALRLIAQRQLDSSSLVMELASNDGYLLKNFVDEGIPVLGIDPADAPVEQARSKGVETINTFFTEDLAKQLASEGRKADVIIANNVLAHVADLNGFVHGISLLLKKDGIASIEMPYVRDLIERCEFDTVYHQHLCYFSITSLVHLFKRHDMEILAIDKLTIHGGSLRITVGKSDNPAASSSVSNYLVTEQQDGIVNPDFFEQFGTRVAEIRDEMYSLIKRLKSEGHTIAAYGAAAKGTTLLSMCGIDNKLVDYVVDRNSYKHGRYMSGARIEIHPVTRLEADMPDYVILLTWNFKDEILAQQQAYRKKGGKFIIPIPSVEIV